MTDKAFAEKQAKMNDAIEAENNALPVCEVCGNRSPTAVTLCSSCRRVICQRCQTGNETACAVCRDKD